MSASTLVVLLAGALLFTTATLAFLLVRRASGRTTSQPGAVIAQQVPAQPAAPVPAQPAAPIDDSAARAERMRNLLLSRMSHDLRSPLNSVVTLSQLLLEGNVGALSLEQRRYVDVIRSSGQTLLALITDILDLAAVESGRLEIEVGLVDLSSLAEAVATTVGPAARARGVPLHVRTPERRLVAQADEDRLRQVLQRLVEHALAETRIGYVELAVSRSLDGQRALVRVHETGEGLSEAARVALSDDRREFDDYITGDRMSGDPAPAALPLVVAARLARLMGVRIGVESSPSYGVSFDLELPLGVGDAATPGQDLLASKLPPDATIAEFGRAGGHVLLVEDDLLERQRVGAELEAAGYEMTLAASGDEGLALLRAGHFDAVILDLVMPGMSGLEVLRTARTDERLAEIPFIVLSALTMTKGERAVLGPGVTSVVRKGETTGEELSLALRRAIKPHAGEPRPAPGGERGPHA